MHRSRLNLAAGGETDRIQAFLDEAQGSPAEVTVTVPPGDDAAAFSVPAGQQVVVSSDASVEGIHFRRAWMTWETIGYRAAAAALSDLAAMAAQPIGLTASVALPPELGVEITSALGRGVGDAAGRAGAAMLGGDLVASPGPAFLDITVIGRAAAPLTRSGAQPGDELWVTGRLGGAAAALRDLERGLEPDRTARSAFDRPSPRLAEARWLSARAQLHAAIDLSDGLMRDARHLAAASGVAVHVDAARLPTSPALDGFRWTRVAAAFALAGGEDYELLLAVPPSSLTPDLIRDFAATFDLPLTQIGHASTGEGLTVDNLHTFGPANLPADGPADPGDSDSGDLDFSDSSFSGFDHFR